MSDCYIKTSLLYVDCPLLTPGRQLQMHKCVMCIHNVCIRIVTVPPTISTVSRLLFKGGFYILVHALCMAIFEANYC